MSAFIDLIFHSPFFISNQPTQPVPDGFMHFFLSWYLQKKQIQQGAPKNAPIHHRKHAFKYCSLIVLVENLLAHYVKQPQPAYLPTPPTFHAFASHLLLVPRNFMPFTAHTAANISSYVVISVAKFIRNLQNKISNDFKSLQKHLMILFHKK